MLPLNQNPSWDLRASLEPYFIEAGLDPDQLHNSDYRKWLIHGLMTYHAIDKRRLELEEIAKGKCNWC